MQLRLDLFPQYLFAYLHSTITVILMPGLAPRVAVTVPIVVVTVPRVVVTAATAASIIFAIALILVDALGGGSALVGRGLLLQGVLDEVKAVREF